MIYYIRSKNYKKTDILVEEANTQICPFGKSKFNLYEA